MLSTIRLVPYWNVNYSTSGFIFTIKIIRLVPYWNVNGIENVLRKRRNKIRLVPYWNVNAKTLYATASDNLY